ncbi:MAG: hypothetical protein JJLCMIEE_00411 [Acidimicrobiales bacterium]|nr:MAG: hypothetical protein EDR02_13815 [Actinomycetota bacterium]MBV6507367.1 hypothetical protein [Acidimicrobiales bacterium]RIK04495.1 MAG: hypothetical protein DCC48_13290 [Acidobacteriota bacterium]
MSEVYAELRGIILADDDLATVACRVPDAGELPWSGFTRAAGLVGTDRDGAASALAEVAALPGAETRVALQAWRCLRDLGVEPPEAAGRVVRGVVVEVGLELGTDVVAAYEDHTARYLNQGGGGAFWERPTDALDSSIDAYLAAGQEVADATGPIEGSLPGPAASGMAAILLLTYRGIHLGSGPMDAIMGDELGGRVTGAAFPLMQALTEMAPREG